MRLKILPIFLAFFLMGLADAMGPNSDAVKEAYPGLSNVTSTLLTFMVFIAFAVFGVPGGLLAARIGKKRLLALGLGINGAALLWPSFQQPPFAVLLGCIFLLGMGTTFLQVAGNPIMRDVSAKGITAATWPSPRASRGSAARFLATCWAPSPCWPFSIAWAGGPVFHCSAA